MSSNHSAIVSRRAVPSLARQQSIARAEESERLRAESKLIAWPAQLGGHVGVLGCRTSSPFLSDDHGNKGKSSSQFSAGDDSSCARPSRASISTARAELR